MSAAERWEELEGEKPGKVSAREATRLTQALWKAGGTRRSTISVLQLLLRLTRGSFAIERSVKWIALELMLTKRMVEYAIHDLVASGLVVVVVQGQGRTKSQYLVNLELLRGLIDPIETRSDCGTEPQPFRVSTEMVAAPFARARPLTTLYPRDPLPPEPATAAKARPSPAASRGDPLRWQNQPDTKCQHGRTRAQGGCRLCHTTRRDDAKAAKRAQAEGEAHKAIQHLAVQREAEVQSRAVSVPPPANWRDR